MPLRPRPARPAARAALLAAALVTAALAGSAGTAGSPVTPATGAVASTGSRGAPLPDPGPAADGLPRSAPATVGRDTALRPLAGSAPAGPATVGATVLGPAAAATPLTVQVDLAPTDSPDLATLADAVSNPASPTYRHFLTVAQFRQRFGASPGNVGRLDAYLSAAGLQVGQTAPNGLSLTVSGSASAVGTAFHQPVVSVRTAAGAVVSGMTAEPRVPADLAGTVDDVQGLQPWVTAQSDSTATPAGGVEAGAATGAPASSATPASSDRSASSAIPDSSATPDSSASSSTPDSSAAPPAPGTCAAMTDVPGSVDPAELAAAYGLGSFWSDQDLGQGTTVGVIEFDSFSMSDIADFDACIGETTSVTVDKAPGADLPGTESPEPTADVESLAEMLPGASIVAYEDTDGSGFGPVMGMAVTSSPLPRVISISWGTCDAQLGSAAEAADDVTLAEAAVQGQTVVVASGDYGAEGCGGGSPTVSADFPASSPYVLAVGGTIYSPGSTPAVWNDNGGTYGATGGGLDPYVAQPTWQTAPGTTADQGSRWCEAAHGCRAEPDVSAIAQSVYPLFCTYGACGTPGSGWPSGWQRVGGTSLGAPSWAAALDMAGQQCGATSGLGLVDPLLYQLADAGASPLGAVAAGTNAWAAGAPAGVFTSTGTGYSPVTGLGALGEGGPSLSAGQLCAAPTGVPVDQLSATSLTLGPTGPGMTAEGTVSVTDDGATPLAVTGVTVAGAAYGTGSPFSASLDACGTASGQTDTVAPGGTCTVDVTFSDAATGTYSDELAVDDDAYGTVQEVALSATVEQLGTVSTDVTSLSLGQIQQDTNTHQAAVVVSDTSSTAPVPSVSASLQSTSSTLSAAPTVQDGCGGSLAAGGSCSVAVVLDSNQGPGTFSGTLVIGVLAANESSVSLAVTATVTAASEAATVTPDPVTLGTVTDGTPTATTVTVADASPSAELGLETLDITGADAGQLSLTDDDCSGTVLQAAATCTATLTLTASSVGAIDATLAVPLADGTTIDVPVTATAQAAPGGGGSGPSGGGSGPSGGGTGPSGGGSPVATPSGSGGGSSGSGGGGSAGPPVASRVAGQTADGTAIAVSQAMYPEAGSASAVVLARDDYFTDALAGGPLAAAVGGPLLITPGAPLASTLDPAVLAEIERVLPTGATVYVLGGPLALAPGIDGQLGQAGYHVQRVYGPDQYGTAVAVAQLLGDPSTVFEATGLDFADALSAVPAAIGAHGAVLLTEGATQDPETAAYLTAHPPTVRYAVGGPLAAAGADPSATAVYGQDQYGTAAAVAARFFSQATEAGVATGSTFSDALAGGVDMGRTGGPMLLVPPSGVPGAIAAYLQGDAGSLAGLTVFGGPLAVSDTTVSALLGAA